MCWRPIFYLCSTMGLLLGLGEKSWVQKLLFFLKDPKYSRHILIRREENYMRKQRKQLPRFDRLSSWAKRTKTDYSYSRGTTRGHNNLASKSNRCASSNSPNRLATVSFRHPKHLCLKLACKKLHPINRQQKIYLAVHNMPSNRFNLCND